MDLGELIKVVDRGRQRFRISDVHLVPDIIFAGYLDEITENVRAVDLIAKSELPHRAFPNARHAFEAGQHVMLLITADDYDLAGARAWTYQLKKDRDFALMPRRRGPPRPDPEVWFEQAVSEMAATWEDLAPGKGHLFDEAKRLLAKQPKRPDNWAGVAIAPELQRRLTGLLARLGKTTAHDVTQAYNGAYAAMSREGHARARLQPVHVARGSNGSVQVTFRPRDPVLDATNVETLASAALLDAGLALDLRLRMPEA